MWIKKRKLTLFDRCFIIVAITYFVWFPFPTFAAPTVEVEAGPKQEAGDKDQVKGCFEIYKTKFPLDFFADQPDFAGDGGCPTLSLFGSSFEFCQPITIWQTIKPVVFLLTIYQAILLL